MSWLAGREALRSQLADDPVLMAFWHGHYGRQPRHFIGYRRPQTADDYPALCYVLTQAVRGGPEGDREWIGLVIAVHEPGMTGDVLDGVARLSEAGALVLDSIDRRWRQTAAFFVGPALENPELEQRHPYYQSEIALPFLITKTA